LPSAKVQPSQVIRGLMALVVADKGIKGPPGILVAERVPTADSEAVAGSRESSDPTRAGAHKGANG